MHFTVFTIYISLTKEQRSSFETFISGGYLRKIISGSNAKSHKFLEDQLKCLRLYRCFNEAEDYKLCKTIK